MHVQVINSCMCTLLRMEQATIIQVHANLQLIADKLGHSPNFTVYLMTLSRDKDSVLNSDENKKSAIDGGAEMPLGS